MQNIMADQESKRSRGNPSWVRGGPSPNPNGRPRTGLAAAEKVRELVDPAEWVAFELSIARDVAQSTERRASAWHSLIDRGFVRPPVGLDASISQASAPQRDWSQMSIDDRRELLARLRAVPALKTDG